MFINYLGNQHKFNLSLLALSINSILLSQTLYAKEIIAELSEVSVVAQENVKASSEQKSKEAIQQELIQNNRDLVRYSPDVGIVNQGRHQKGFAIRGVEDNRVGVSIDGIALPDSEENSLYDFRIMLNSKCGIMCEAPHENLHIIRCYAKFYKFMSNITIQ
ncbi:TonB-dependent receptor plug domain-containing protein, partial [Mannheimia sp. E30BD]|uniref:TonB-dependent receptor plug domain-containing protein n=1 Tax=Mannheimia sp. E30BD TaxID=3278708 RepID=UPI00359D65C4